MGRWDWLNTKGEDKPVEPKKTPEKPKPEIRIETKYVEKRVTIRVPWWISFISHVTAMCFHGIGVFVIGLISYPRAYFETATEGLIDTSPKKKEFIDVGEWFSRMVIGFVFIVIVLVMSLFIAFSTLRSWSGDSNRWIGQFTDYMDDVWESLDRRSNG